jgi:hypothetical protein
LEPCLLGAPVGGVLVAALGTLSSGRQWQTAHQVHASYHCCFSHSSVKTLQWHSKNSMEGLCHDFPGGKCAQVPARGAALRWHPKQEARWQRDGQLFARLFRSGESTSPLADSVLQVLAHFSPHSYLLRFLCCFGLSLLPFGSFLHLFPSLQSPLPEPLLTKCLLRLNP